MVVSGVSLDRCQERPADLSRTRPTEGSSVDRDIPRVLPTPETRENMSNDSKHPGTLDAIAQIPTSRRAFLRTASLSAVGAGALVACSKGGAAAAQKPAATTAASAGHEMAPVALAGTPV